MTPLASMSIPRSDDASLMIAPPRSDADFRQLRVQALLDLRRNIPVLRRHHHQRLVDDQRQSALLRDVADHDVETVGNLLQALVAGRLQLLARGAGILA